jgi:hypothetical protein
VFRNDRPGSNVWSNAEPTTVFAAFNAPRAYYDRRADVLSVTMREGEPKYVVVGRGTFVIFADEEGIWQVDLEAVSWDSDVDEAFPLAKIEVLQGMRPQRREGTEIEGSSVLS